MLAAGKGHQHGQCISLVHRLAQDPPIDNHRRVGPQYAGARGVAKRDKTCRRLAPRKALDIGNGRFVVQGSFINSGADQGEGHTDLGQQFTSPRGARGQIKRIHCSLSLWGSITRQSLAIHSIDFIATTQPTQAKTDPGP